GSRPAAALASPMGDWNAMGGGGRRVTPLLRRDSITRAVAFARGQGAGAAGATDHSLSIRRRVEYRARAADAEERISDGRGRPHHQYLAGGDLSVAGGL